MRKKKKIISAHSCRGK